MSRSILIKKNFFPQAKFPIGKATPLNAKRGNFFVTMMEVFSSNELSQRRLCGVGQVVIFSYLLVHGSYPNISTRPRRMLLFQVLNPALPLLPYDLKILFYFQH